MAEERETASSPSQEFGPPTRDAAEAMIDASIAYHNEFVENYGLAGADYSPI
jgi:hypothetical protein